MHACMHACTVVGLRSIARALTIVRLSDSFFFFSFIYILNSSHSLSLSLDSFMNLDSVCLGLLFRVPFCLDRLCWTFFPFQICFRPRKYPLRWLTRTNTYCRSHCPRTMSSILFAKHVSFEDSVSSSRPVITLKREPGDINHQTKASQLPIVKRSASSCLYDKCGRRHQCCRCQPP